MTEKQSFSVFVRALGVLVVLDGLLLNLAFCCARDRPAGLNLLPDPSESAMNTSSTKVVDNADEGDCK